MADDPLALEISYLRIAADGIRIWPQGMDTDGVGAAFGRAADALEAVLKAHRNADGRCAWCRNADGQRQKWPCGEYLTITRALTGEGGSGDG